MKAKSKNDKKRKEAIKLALEFLDKKGVKFQEGIARNIIFVTNIKSPKYEHFRYVYINGTARGESYAFMVIVDSKENRVFSAAQMDYNYAENFEFKL